MAMNKGVNQMKNMKIEISFHESRYNKNIGRHTVEGFEANCLNPEDFNCSQIYSGRMDSESEAIADIQDRFPMAQIVVVK